MEGPSTPAQQSQGKPTIRVGSQVLTASECLRGRLGPRLDLTWDRTTATMRVAPSESDSFSHTHHGTQQSLRGVPFEHSPQCPFLQGLPGSQTPLRPCVVLFIRNTQNGTFLATQRHPNMSFGSSWVLPGGHLEPGEGLLEGGLRECQEEVGLDPARVSWVDPAPMVWQSVLLSEQGSRIRRAAVVLCLRVESEPFEVKAQESEVQAWEWRSFEAEETEWGGGWAAGHLRYLRFLSWRRREGKAQ